MLKKSALSAAVALSLGTGAAQATVFSMTFMDYDAFADNSNVVGTVDTANGGSGSFNSGGTPFFGHEWTATVVTTFETTGAGSWHFSAADGASATSSYNFTLAPGQVAMGVLFNWGDIEVGMPVLNIVNADGSGVDIDGDGTLGTIGCCGPLWQGATAPGFAGVVVPIPTAAWLFGSGLVGLIGMARRKAA